MSSTARQCCSAGVDRFCLSDCQAVPLYGCWPLMIVNDCQAVLLYRIRPLLIHSDDCQAGLNKRVDPSVSYFRLLDEGEYKQALRLARASLGPLAAQHRELLPALKATLLAFAKPGIHLPNSPPSPAVLATSLQVIAGWVARPVALPRLSLGACSVGCPSSN
jgi:hypothetical protein